MAVDAYLELKDDSGPIKTEAKDSKHEGLMPIRDYSFGVENGSKSSGTSGMGAGKVQMNKFAFKVDNSKASPTLFKYCCNGKHCPEATLYIRKAGGKPQDYYIWHFKDLVITKFELSSGEEIVESIEFNYTAVACEYKPQKQDGSLDSGVKGGWDQKQNAEWTK